MTDFSGRAVYDVQAHRFDHRTGLLPGTCERVVAGVRALSGCHQSACVCEFGCGTGQLGMYLAKAFGRYIGMDVSPEMLKQFKIAQHQQATELPLGSEPPSLSSPSLSPPSLSIVQADGNRAWPLADSSADIIFSSRAIHWLNLEHIVAEVFRVAKAGEATLIVGRVERASDGWEAQLRRHCHKLLERHGLKPRNGGQHLKRLLEYYDQMPQGRQSNGRFGAQVLPRDIVDRWYQKRPLQQSLNDWAGKVGLAGTKPSAKLKSDILAELKNWAIARYGDNLPTETERHYVLYGIKIFS